MLVPTALLGIGTLGVGAFPLTHPTPHTLVAFGSYLLGLDRGHQRGSAHPSGGQV